VTEGVSERRASILDRLAARLRGADLVVPVAVGGLLLVAVAVHLALARHVLAPWIEPDELQYAETARSFASSGHYLYRDHPYALRTIYPALISPAWLVGSVHTAYTLIKIINVVLMVAGAIPLYLWGRRLVAPSWAALAVVLYLVMPGFMYTGELVTENAFVPAMVLALFALAVAIERPSLLTQALALGAIVLAVAVRVQGLILLVVLPTAIALELLLTAIAAPGDRKRLVLRRLRAFLPSLATVGLGVLAYVGYELARGASLSSGLGVYERVTNAHYSLRLALRWIAYHFGELGFSVGLIPLSALIVLFGLASSRRTAVGAAERAFVVVATAAVFWMVVQVGTFASQFSLRVEERNMFNVAPVLFLALAVWLARGLPRPPALTAAAAVVPVAFLLVLPLQSLFSTLAFFTDTFALIPLWRLSFHTGADLTIVLGLGALGAGLLFASVPRRWARFAVPVVIAAFLLVSSRSVFNQVTFISSATRHAGGLAGNPNWIDRAVGRNSRVEFLYTTDIDRDQHILWQSEFWNRSLRRVFGVTSQDPSIPDVSAPLDYGNGRIAPILPASSPDARPRYVVAASTVDVDGVRVAHAGFLTLTRANAPLRLASSTLGVSPDGWTAGWGDYLHYVPPAPGERVNLNLSRPGAKGAGPAKVTVKVGRLRSSNGAAQPGRVWTQRQVTLRGDATQTLSLPLRPEPFVVQLSISPTFPGTLLNPADTRRLGVVPTFALQ
jgi:hypothetical protein